MSEGEGGRGPGAPGAAPAGALCGVDAHGLSGWLADADGAREVTLFHGERALLTIAPEPGLAEGRLPGDAPGRRLYAFDLAAAAAAAAAREAAGGDAPAAFRALSGGVELAGATPPLSAADLPLVAAIARAGAPRPPPPRAEGLKAGFAAAARLVSGVVRRGPWRVLAFATRMIALEGVAGAVRFAMLPRVQRHQWLIDRRRVQHAAADLTVTPAPLRLQPLPPPSRPFETAIFEASPKDDGSEASLTAYQRFALARLRYPKPITTDAERRAALIWYIETYSTFRRPFKVPFSGRQIAWLLSHEDASTPSAGSRLVDWFLQARDAREVARDAAWSQARTAYWWALQKAVELNIEHALIPQGFIDRLRAPLGEAGDAAPMCEFLRQHFALEPSFVADLASSAGRFEAYVRLLMAEEGLHFSLFMPNGVLERIARLAPCVAPGAHEGFDGEAVRARALEAASHGEQSARIRRSGADLSAARLGQDWVSAVKQDDGPAYSQAGRSGPPGGSALPFPVRVIGPLNSRSGLGQASRLSIASLQAVGVAVETVDFLLDNPAPRGRYHANAFDLTPGFGVNLLHLSGESLPLAAAFMAPAFFAERANVGYFFWELPHPAECHELALRQLDELWVASSFNRDTYAPYLPGAVFRVGMALEPAREPLADRAKTRERFGLPPSAFVFITTFDSFSFISRKNPAGSIRAFKRAFPLGSEDVRLIVKTHNLMRTLGEARADTLRAEILSLCGSDPRIVLINETLEHADLLTLKSACDAYVSLHRSEGWGFGMVESMQLGLPVIATAFSGNLDFCTEETAWLVDYRKVGLASDEYIFVRPQDYWAEPDLDSAAQRMRQAQADPQAAAAKGAVARRCVQRTLSPEAVGAVYLARLRALAASRDAAGA